MRRTVFVVPADLVPVIQAACTDQIAERMRRDLARRVEDSGIAADGGSWLKEAGEATVRALEKPAAPRPAPNSPGTAASGCALRLLRPG